MPTTNYKLILKKDLKIKTFNVSDHAMVSYLYGTLHARNAFPFKILNKLNDNIYAIDLLKNLDICSTFNVEDGSDETICETPSLFHSKIYYPVQQKQLIR